MQQKAIVNESSHASLHFTPTSLFVGLTVPPKGMVLRQSLLE